MKPVLSCLIAFSALVASCASLAPSTLEPSSASDPANPPSAADLTLLLAIWPDGENGGSLHLVDARTGVDLPGREPIFLGGNYWHAISPDGHTVAVVTLPMTGTPMGGMLNLIDLQSWTRDATQVQFDLWPTKLIFSRDGAQLAVGGSSSNESKLVLFDVTRKAALAPVSLNFDPLDFEVTPDGHSLLIYGARYPGTTGANPIPIAAGFDVDEMRIVWEIELTGVKDGQYAPDGVSDKINHDTSIWWHPAIAFAPEAQRLYVVHADEDVLTTVDFKAHSRRDLEIRPRAGLLETIVGLGSSRAYAKELNGASKAGVLSPDGERLYVVGHKMSSSQDANGAWDIEEASLGLESIRLGTAELLMTLDTPATQIAWSADGRHLLLGGRDRSGNVWTDVLDIGTRMVQAHLPKMDLLTAQPVDGTPIIAGSYTGSGQTSQVQLIDTTSWDPLVEWTIAGYADIWWAGRPMAD
jgi:WD40 repeat protein